MYNSVHCNTDGRNLDHEICNLTNGYLIIQAIMSLGIPVNLSHKFKLSERTSEVVIFSTESKHIYIVRFQLHHDRGDVAFRGTAHT